MVEHFASENLFTHLQFSQTTLWRAGKASGWVSGDDSPLRDRLFFLVKSRHKSFARRIAREPTGKNNLAGNAVRSRRLACKTGSFRKELASALIVCNGLLRVNTREPG